jgi:hypothetical protein
VLRASNGPRLTSAALLQAAALLCSVQAGGAEDLRPVEVVVCASHHHVLAHWLRAASEGRLPREGVSVVHLDAHPDLAVPEQPLSKGWPANPLATVAALDIASFQLAAAWIGLVDRVIWLRPDFARQLPDGLSRFHLGALPSGRLRVDDPSDYYVLDDGFASTAALRSPVTVERRVMSLTAAAGSPAPPSPTILDVDLDAFATRNPAAERLREAGLSEQDLIELRRIFARENLVFARDPELRVREFQETLEAIRSLAEGSPSQWPGAIVVLWQRGVGPLDLVSLARLLSRVSQEASLESLLEDGRDLVGLPEHVQPTRSQILEQARALGDLVRSGWVRPSLVTVARSVGDGFTPAADWPLIERAVLSELLDALDTPHLLYPHPLHPAPDN